MFGVALFLSWSQYTRSHGCLIAGLVKFRTWSYLKCVLKGPKLLQTCFLSLYYSSDTISPTLCHAAVKSSQISSKILHHLKAPLDFISQCTPSNGSSGSDSHSWRRSSSSDRSDTSARASAIIRRCRAAISSICWDASWRDGDGGGRNITLGECLTISDRRREVGWVWNDSRRRRCCCAISVVLVN